MQENMQYRSFDMDIGWSEWQTVDIDPTCEHSDVLVAGLWETIHPENPGDTSDGASLTQTDTKGNPTGAGVCFVQHTGGLTLIEYKLT